LLTLDIIIFLCGGTLINVFTMHEHKLSRYCNTPTRKYPSNPVPFKTLRCHSPVWNPNTTKLINILLSIQEHLSCPHSASISSSLVKKYLGQGQVGLLFTAGQKYAWAWSGPISSFMYKMSTLIIFKVRLLRVAKIRHT